MFYWPLSWSFFHWVSFLVTLVCVQVLPMSRWDDLCHDGSEVVEYSVMQSDSARTEEWTRKTLPVLSWLVSKLRHVSTPQISSWQSTLVTEGSASQLQMSRVSGLWGKQSDGKEVDGKKGHTTFNFRLKADVDGHFWISHAVNRWTRCCPLGETTLMKNGVFSEQGYIAKQHRVSYCLAFTQVSLLPCHVKPKSIKDSITLVAPTETRKT